MDSTRSGRLDRLTRALVPAAALTVFAFDADRGAVGDAVTVVFVSVFVSLLSTPWWPTAEQRGRPRFECLQGMVMIWFGVTFTTHLTWELAWVLLRKRIIASPDAIWSYPWWAYIDGGDARYASNNGQLITLESLTAIVACWGSVPSGSATARTGRTRPQR